MQQKSKLPLPDTILKLLHPTSTPRFQRILHTQKSVISNSLFNTDSNNNSENSDTKRGKIYIFSDSMIKNTLLGTEYQLCAITMHLSYWSRQTARKLMLLFHILGLLI